jgi:ATP-dependent DNA helicase RecG
MNDFLSGVLDILVSTTVIEVGVDVPNATVMMIESPERFGLAQLHQLRGRVGRGAHLSYCYLMRSESGQISERLQAIESTNDGFELAELDLRLRGAGALYGTSQHGILDLCVADFTDIKLIARARSAALNFLENSDNLLQYTHIKKRILELQHVVHLN